MKKKLQQYLNALVQYNGSDLHLKSSSVAWIRVEGILRRLGDEILSPNIVEEIVKYITTKEQYKKLRLNRDIDFTYIADEKNRFRVNIFYQMEGLSIVMRKIPIDIPTLDTLKLPERIKSFTNIQRGLVLITGVTGSGKSTTLAALLDEINTKSHKHIITIEDPIEFIHKNKECLINQRAIGADTHSFSDALRASLREDPDIIFVGEMRDLETIDIALHAANTGHLVFSTIHTLDAKETIDRIVGMFDKSEQNRVRLSLGSVLQGIVSQRLVPTKDGKRTAVVEILIKTARIEQLIIDNLDHEIPDALFDGKEIYGTQTFDQALLGLFLEGKISQKTTLEYATSIADMRLKMDTIDKHTPTSDTNQDAIPDVFGFKES